MIQLNLKGFTIILMGYICCISPSNAIEDAGEVWQRTPTSRKKLRKSPSLGVVEDLQLPAGSPVFGRQSFNYLADSFTITAGNDIIFLKTIDASGFDQTLLPKRSRTYINPSCPLPTLWSTFQSTLHRIINISVNFTKKAVLAIKRYFIDFIEMPRHQSIEQARNISINTTSNNIYHFVCHDDEQSNTQDEKVSDYNPPTLTAITDITSLSSIHIGDGAEYVYFGELQETEDFKEYSCY